MKILVIKFRNIGDVLLTTPLFENLRFAFKDAIIHAAINEQSAEMLEGNPYIDKIFSYHRLAIKNLTVLKRLRAELSYFWQFIGGYDIVINTTEGDRGAFIAFLSRAQTYIAPKKHFLKSPDLFLPAYKGHIIESHLDAIRLLNKDIISKKVKIKYENVHLEHLYAHKLPQYYIHIHPLSRWQFKCIDDCLCAKIIDYIQTELHIPVVLSAAHDRDELNRIDVILKHCRSQPLNFSGKLTLKELAALADKAACFIGVDTAAMHIAAALETPVIAFFVASAVFHWGAWDNTVWECPYTNENGIQRMGKHSIFVKNTALYDREIMNNLKTHGSFNIDNFDFECFKKELISKIQPHKATKP